MPHPVIAKDNVAVITGGASGIGLAAAMAFVRAGMKVCIADIDQGRLAEANMKQQTEPLAEVSNLLRTLQGAWSQCAAANELEPALR